VYFVASTLMNRRPVRFASLRAISVLPTPVGPIMIMFFGATSCPHGFREAAPPPAVADRTHAKSVRRALSVKPSATIGGAIRNRWRRQASGIHAADVAPKNIIMIRPTGVGKTEIAPKAWNLTGAPFIKRARNTPKWAITGETSRA